MTAEILAVQLMISIDRVAIKCKCKVVLVQVVLNPLQRSCPLLASVVLNVQIFDYIQDIKEDNLAVAESLKLLQLCQTPAS